MKESYSLRTHTFDTEREVAIADHDELVTFKHDLHRGLKSRQIAMALRPYVHASTGLHLDRDWRGNRNWLNHWDRRY